MKKTLVLMAVVIALIAGVLVIRHREEAESLRERAEQRLLTFGDREVEAIVLTVEGVDWRLEPADGLWRVIEPVEDAADPDAVNQLIAAANRVLVTRVIDEPEALSAYGLDPAVATVRFEGVGAVLHLGTVSPTGDGLFARVDGRPGVLVLESTMLTAAALDHPDPQRLRDPQLFGIPRTDVAGLRASLRTEELRVERRPDGWWIAEPRALPASDEVVEGLLDAFDEATVLEFRDGADGASPELGFGDDSLGVDVETSDGIRRFVVGSRTPGGERFATRDDRSAVLKIDGGGFDDLGFDLQNLAARRLSRVNRYHIDRFTYRNGGASLTAERIGEQWATEQGDPVPEETVYAMLASVLETPVAGWSGTASAGASPIAELRYRLQDGNEGAIAFLPGNRATVSGVEGVVYDLEGPPPPVTR